MPEQGRLIALDGFEVWAYAVVRDGGLRVRLPLGEWERSGLAEGRRIPVRVGNRPDVWLFAAHVAEVPPVAWVTLAHQTGEKVPPAPKS